MLRWFGEFRDPSTHSDVPERARTESSRAEEVEMDRAGVAHRVAVASSSLNDAGYRVCIRCVMDTTEPELLFDDDGVCSNCTTFLKRREGLPCNQPDAAMRLERLVDEIRSAGRGKKYDCVIGVSGGTDSTYVAWKAKELGLRPLAVHFDNGWNSELAVKNIENTLDCLGIDLYTHVMDWEEFRSLQVAFLRASTPDGEIPTDHAILAVLLAAAAREGLRYIVSGSNTTNEGNLPVSWVYGASDWRYICSVARQFGAVKQRRYPHYGVVSRLYNVLVRRIRSVQLLNYVPYVKADAVATLERELGWRNYGGKHYESIYTRFFQGYILPRKFAIDKRRCHLSALVTTGQIDRADALREFEADPYPDQMMAEDREYVLKKLRLSEEEFDAILSTPVRSYRDYSTYAPLFARLRGVGNFLARFGIVPKRIGF